MGENQGTTREGQKSTEGNHKKAPTACSSAGISRSKNGKKKKRVFFLQGSVYVLRVLVEKTGLKQFARGFNKQ